MVRGLFFRLGKLPVKTQRGVKTGEYDLDGCILRMQAVFDRGTDPADVFAQGADVRVAEAFAQNVDSPLAGPFVTGEDLEQGRLAGTVRAEQGPVLARLNSPRDVIENRAAIADEANAV